MGFRRFTESNLKSIGIPANNGQARLGEGGLSRGAQCVSLPEDGSVRLHAPWSIRHLRRGGAPRRAATRHGQAAYSWNISIVCTLCRARTCICCLRRLNLQLRGLSQCYKTCHYDLHVDTGEESDNKVAHSKNAWTHVSPTYSSKWKGSRKSSEDVIIGRRQHIGNLTELHLGIADLWTLLFPARWSLCQSHECKGVDFDKHLISWPQSINASNFQHEYN